MHLSIARAIHFRIHHTVMGFWIVDLDCGLDIAAAEVLFVCVAPMLEQG
jgi:hypothetical protein